MIREWKSILEECPDCFSDEVEAHTDCEEDWEAHNGDAVRCACCKLQGAYLCEDDFEHVCWTEWER